MPRDFFNTTGKRIRLLRQDLGLKQSALVTQLQRLGVDITANYISTLENSSRVPSGEVLRALAITLKTSTDYLLMLSDDPLARDDESENAILEGRIYYQVQTPEEWEKLQTLVDAFQRMAPDDQAAILHLVERLTEAVKPRVIGGEENNDNSNGLTYHTEPSGESSVQR